MTPKEKRAWNQMQNFIDLNRKKCNGQFKINATDREIVLMALRSDGTVSDRTTIKR